VHNIGKHYEEKIFKMGKALNGLKRKVSTKQQSFGEKNKGLSHIF
jgi:hypothetical protein